MSRDGRRGLNLGLAIGWGAVLFLTLILPADVDKVATVWRLVGGYPVGVVIAGVAVGWWLDQRQAHRQRKAGE